ncbi:serine/threonine-protein phosphatase 2A regulatory subunit B'' subunit delta-like [Symsagittifera roscoffensis]|uniref:serine/threonine-protein phosphatase 2A regulatory subunit B'' subunit delta-like n=1 Tax=Symsagittifera roscoffensis TaxID=84072 RepID=UPI00307C8145
MTGPKMDPWNDSGSNIAATFASNTGNLQPVLRWKFDELFFRWMSLPQTVQYMEKIASKIRDNEDPSQVPWSANTSDANYNFGQNSVSSTHSTSVSGINVNGGYPISNGATQQRFQSTVGGMAVTPTPPAIASPRNNSTGRHGKKGVYSPRSSHSNEKVLSPRRSDEQVANSAISAWPSSSQSATSPAAVSVLTKYPTVDSDSTATEASNAIQTAKQTSPPAKTTDGTVTATLDTSTGTQQSVTTSATTSIPQFYFPRGVPLTNVETQKTLSNLRDAFEKLPNRKANKANMHQIMKIIGLPLYARVPLLAKCKVGGDSPSAFVSADTFISTWKNIISDSHDAAARFVKTASRRSSSGGGDYLIPGDFECMLQDVVDTHKGLLFLQEAKDFHSRYIATVIARIFYSVNRSWSGKLSLHEVRNSNLIQTFEQLEVEEDINSVRDFFSYEHFYVIYCKFWDIDLDRDLLVSHSDLCRHESHAVSQRAIDRIFQGTVSKELTSKSMKMSYSDFVWFLISEEDKQSATSIEYWFRIMDLDGDGALSMYELQHFWDEQLQRMVQQDFADLLPFEDILCEMLDLVKPADPTRITLSDLKRCKLTPVFLNTFINFKKFLDIQQRQNVGLYRDEEERRLSELETEWERYAKEEYERLVSEDGDQESYMSYEDDFEPVGAANIGESGNLSSEQQQNSVGQLSMSAISGNFILGKNTMEPNADQAEITDAIMEPADESGTEKYVDKLDLDMLKLGSS